MKKITIAFALIVALCLPLSACTAASKMETALEKGDYLQAYKIFEKSSNNDNVKDVLINEMETAISDCNYEKVGTLYTSFRFLVAEFDAMCNKAIKQGIENYGAGSIPLEDVQTLLTKCVLAMNHTEQVERSEQVERITTSKQNFKDAIELQNNHNYIEALDLFRMVCEEDTENYTTAQERCNEIIDVLSGNTEGATKINYLEVSAKQLFDEFEVNPVKAELDYVGKYVAVTGYFGYVYGGPYFSFHADVTSTYRHSISCEVIAAGYEDIISEANEGKKITVFGQITGTAKQSDTSTYTIKAIKVELAPELSANETGYIEVTPDELIEICYNDSYDAQERFLGKHIVFTGKIDSIGAEALRIDNQSIETHKGSIYCSYTSNEIKALVAEKRNGDTATVWGKVTGLQGYLSIRYNVDIVNIQ